MLRSLHLKGDEAGEVIDIPGLARVHLIPDGSRTRVVIVLDEQHDGRVHPHSLDIDDFLPNWKPGGIYYDSAAGYDPADPLLAKFIEQLHEWDHDRDGQPDPVARATRERIEAALKSSPRPKPFVRPTKGLYTRFLMLLLPPQPPDQIVYSFGDLRVRFRWFHYPLALLGIVTFVALLNLQIHYLPWLRYSVISGGVAAYERFGLVVPAAVIGYLFLSRRLTRNGHSMDDGHSPLTTGLLNIAAAWEEKVFREGSERWNWWQRAVSCLLFGAIHMPNLIYPLASILPLALGGAWFMGIYLRTMRRTGNRRLAVLNAAVWHRAYNRLALTVMVLWLAFVYGDKLYHVVAAFVAGLLSVLVLRLRDRRN